MCSTMWRRWLRATPPCCCAGNPVPARNSWPRPSISAAAGRTELYGRVCSAAAPARKSGRNGAGRTRRGAVAFSRAVRRGTAAAAAVSRAAAVIARAIAARAAAPFTEQNGTEQTHGFSLVHEIGSCLPFHHMREGARARSIGGEKPGRGAFFTKTVDDSLRHIPEVAGGDGVAAAEPAHASSPSAPLGRSCLTIWRYSRSS